MVSIKEVAEAAGVSTATVSRVLSNGLHVRPEVRARVMAAVERLGYRPNLVARSLRPLLTLACAASCTTRSLSACSVSGRSVCSHRSSVVSSGTVSKYTRQNQRNTRLSPTRSSVSR